MNRRHYTIMTFDDHRAAARELATVRRSLTEFDKLSRFGRRVPGRLHTNVKRIHNALDRIQTGMCEVLARTLPSHAQTGSCWAELETMKPDAAARRSIAVLKLDQHIRTARALGPAKPAVRRFLGIINKRRYLPVRIMDHAIRINILIQVLRCQMEDVRFYTLRGRGIPWVNCWLGPSNCFDGEEDGCRADAQPAGEGRE